MDTDVLIAGAGPVGLFLAGELALAGCSVVVLEKAECAESPLKVLPFGIRGLSSSTVEALERRGLFEALQLHKRMRNPFGDGASTQAGHFAGIPFHYGDIDRAQWPFRLSGATPVHALAEMAELEAMLEQRALSLGVVIRRGLALECVEQDADAVLVRAGGQSFAAPWLVGCDGARSAVRKQCGFAFEGTEPEFTGYTVKVEFADPALLPPGRNVTRAGMYFQSQPGYVAMQDFDGGAFHHSGAPLTLEHVQQVLRRLSGTEVTLTALHVATTWTDRARQVTQYRHGRVLLAGDAAHIHSPLGGQGLNLGIGDAMNLGWKLAATIHGQAPHGLLDTYHAERHPVGAQVLDWSRAQVMLMKPEALPLHAIFRDLMKTRDAATYVAGRVWGVQTRYDLGDPHPLVGRSVPDFEFEDEMTLATLLRDGQGLLLDLGADVTLPGVRHVAASVKNTLGLSALLIRPDGIVAWVADGAPDCSSLHQAAVRWFKV
ncbi:FAD-dependent monooxygenase [Duganella guangzhouensis]|nr:FAD-dependent monooxygenase [Duganella guangzhouensis]